jgi:(p)ppGpp synthase/HD superfamily hydrolase
MSNLERAIVIAAEGHAGTTDKAGAPYILHCLRVMFAMSEANERVVGVLHDVVEDCAGWTLDRVRAEGFSEEVLAALDSVTKRDGEEYFSFVRRAAANPIGRKVKLADLKDNSDLARISSPTERDLERVETYRTAIAIIEQMDG